MSEGHLKRVVVKVGTHIVLDENGELHKKRLKHLIGELGPYLLEGVEVVWVSSGAVGLGRKQLKKQERLNLQELQACAAVGQTQLMDFYREAFAPFKREVAQILLSADDFLNRERYLSLRGTMQTLFSWRVISVVNENDTVSTMELARLEKAKSFGDNDKLAAILASRLDADLLINLTKVDGIYQEDPLENPEAKRIPIVEGLDILNSIRSDSKTAFGRGGLLTKLEAARTCSLSGIPMVIACGREENILNRILKDPFSTDKDRPGTLIVPQGRNLPDRKHWVAFASGFSGIVQINMGATMALIDHQASLLPAGILEVTGEFEASEIVSVQNHEGLEIGRGIVNYGSTELQAIQGKQSYEIKEIIGRSGPEEIIHRDRLVIFQEYE